MIFHLRHFSIADICIARESGPFNDWHFNLGGNYVCRLMEYAPGIDGWDYGRIPVEVTRVSLLDVEGVGYEIPCAVFRFRTYDEMKAIHDERNGHLIAYGMLDGQDVEYLRLTWDAYKKNMAKLPSSFYGQHVAIAESDNVRAYVVGPDGSKRIEGDLECVMSMATT